MKSILLGTVAVAALAAPALAAPDRLEQSSACDAMAAGARFECMQQLRTDDPGRATDRAINAPDGVSSGLNGSAGVNVSQAGEDDGIEDEIGDAGQAAGRDIGDAADEAGDAISNAADEAGDAIDNGADEIGDAF